MVTKKDDAAAVVEQSTQDVQRKFDEANAQGFFGEPVDETPRENYTVSGVTSGKETPETATKK